MRAFFATAVVLLFLAAQDANGQDYFPIGDSYSWYFESSIGTWDMSERGNAVFGGTTVRKRKNIYIETPPFAVQLFTYWSKNETGNVFLHGFEAIGSGTGTYYDPPVLYLPANPVVGAEFSTTFDSHDLQTDEVLDADVTWRFVVAANEQVVVPFGTFDTIRVDWVVPVLAGGFGLAGRPTTRLAGEEILESYWYAANHGLVRHMPAQGGPYELLEFGFILATQESTWGRLKSRY